MHLDARQTVPGFVAKAIDRFKAALAERGATSGLRAEKKSATEGSLTIYDAIGKDTWFGGGIDAKDVLARLDELKGVKRLDVYINSPGGSVWDGKTIYNQIKRFPAEKVVHVDGIAASAASLIAMAGDRIITEAGGTWLVHRVSSGAYGFSEDLRRAANDIDAETKSILGVYVERTGKPADQIEAWMMENEIVDAVTAKARGWTDEIAEADEARAQSAAASTPRPVSASVRVAVARAKAKELSEKFGACAAKGPGLPGSASHAG